MGRKPSPDGTDNPTSPSHDLADALLVRVANGDRQAFGDLFDVVISRVLGVCISVLRDRALAEETAQEAMVEVWQKAGRFDSEQGRALTWILVIARRRAIDRVRSEQARRARDLAQGREHPEVIELDLDALGDRIESARIPDMLGTLTPLQREALMLAFYRGLTYPEVATELGIPLGTAKTRIRDALRALRTQIGAVP